MRSSLLLAWIGLLLIGFVQFAPITLHAASIIIVDCGKDDAGAVRPDAVPIKDAQGVTLDYECNFIDFVREIKLLINFAFIAALPITVISITIAGVRILLAQGNTSELNRAKAFLGNIMWGFLFVLSAWLLVYTISSYLLKPEFYNVFLGSPDSPEQIN